MASSSQQKQSVITKIRAITKVVNDPGTNPLDSFISNTIGPVLDDGLKSFDKQSPKKLTDLQSKSSKKKESKTDVFGDLIDIADAFLSGANKKIQLQSPLESKSRLKQITNESIDETLKSVKSIIGNAADQVLFVGDGICGTNKTFPSNTVSLKPSDFDFMNILQVDPTSNMGQILYEGKSNGSVQMNTELFNLFNSGGNYNLATPKGDVLMTTTWDVSNQKFNVSGLTGNTVNEFVQGYFSTVQLPNLKDVTKMSTLLTLKGDNSAPIGLDIGMNELNRLLSKMLKSCNGAKVNSLSKANFETNDEIEESYFDFEDVEGIDLEEESRRFQKVIKFKDCNDVVVPSDISTFEDFVYMVNNNNKMSLNQVVDNTLYNVANLSYQNSGQAASLQNFHINIMNNFILNMPKALIGSVLSPKFLLPIVVIYKAVVLKGQDLLVSAKELLKKLYKLFTKIIKDIFWKFLTEIWTRIKRDILDFIKQLALKILKDKFKKYALIIAGLIALINAVISNNLEDCNALYNTILTTINTALSAASISLPLPALLASFANLRPGTSETSMLIDFIENAQKNGVNLNDIHGEPNKQINQAKSVISGIVGNVVNNGVAAGGNETGFGFTAQGVPVTIPRGSLKVNSVFY
jgi:hypothetical protein